MQCGGQLEACYHLALEVGLDRQSGIAVVLEKSVQFGLRQTRVAARLEPDVHFSMFKDHADRLDDT